MKKFDKLFGIKTLQLTVYEDIAHLETHINNARGKNGKTYSRSNEIKELEDGDRLKFKLKNDVDFIEKEVIAEVFFEKTKLSEMNTSFIDICTVKIIKDE